MASKEATVYIVDCGASMGEKGAGRRKTNLEWALEYVWDRITATVATERKTAFVGVVGLRTDETENPLQSEVDYQHISIIQKLQQTLMPDLRRLSSRLVVNETDDGDALSALVIAIQMIAEHCKKLSYIRQVVLVTDGKAHMQSDDLAQITEKLKDDKIQLTILGVDFDDADFGFKEEDKSGIKAANEKTLRKMCAQCNGNFGTLAQAVEELSMPRVKAVRPTPSYRGPLTLGDVEQLGSGISISVERYPKVMIASAPTASSFVVREGMASQATQAAVGGSSTDSAAADGLTAVKNARTYQVNDENAPGGKKDVSMDELAKGYEYGRTAVHISESDRNVTTYETLASFQIVGFVAAAAYERFLDMSRSCLIIAAKYDRESDAALSAFIHALYELETYAVARLVPRENKEPKMLLLSPNIEPGFECLYDVELPFAEDVRSYVFPPLDKVLTVGGKELKVHRNLPSDELQHAMDDYVDSMDLSTFGNDDEGNPVEYAAIDETYSPMLHRLQQVIKHRAVYPEAPPPETYEILTRYSHIPEDLRQKSQKHLDRVSKAANVKKVPPKTMSRGFGRKGRDEPKPLSDLDVDALLRQDPKRKSKRIDPKNAVPEFRQLVANAESIGELESGCQQLKNIIHDWIRHSVGNSNYGRAIEAVRVMREETLDMEEPELYNRFLKELKKKLLAEEFGGDRKEMWWLVRVNKLGLVTSKESDQSSVSEEDGKTFLTAK